MGDDFFRQWRGCHSKKRYERAFDALQAAKQNKQRAYACAFCKRWHLASFSR